MMIQQPSNARINLPEINCGNIQVLDEKQADSGQVQ
jgi:hypothetical protein